MEERWDELLGVFNKILSVCCALLTICEQKRKILVAANSQELEMVTKQEDAMLLQLDSLEKMREKIISEIMAVYAIQDGEVSLKVLKKIAKPDVGEQLEIFNKEFKQFMAEFVPLNRLNADLIQQALVFINYNVNILSQTVVGPTYAAKGQSEQHRQRTIFDSKA